MDIRELEEALRDVWLPDYDTCDGKRILEAAQAYLELKKRVEAGEVKVVPCEATSEMRNGYVVASSMNNGKLSWLRGVKSYIQAAPDVLAELEKNDD